MSNTRRSELPVGPPAEDYGLGLCLGCLGEHIAGELPAGSFAFAVTLAPMLWPPGVRDAIPVAVPACWRHVLDAAKPPPSRLLAANGRRP